MTQKSWPWDTSVGLGDGAADLSEGLAREFLATYFGVQDPAVEGVCKGLDIGELEVSGAASPLSVDPGAAICYGLYISDASVNLAVSTPAVGTTGWRVVLQTNWAGTGGAGLEARTRLAVIMSADNDPSIPALTQTFGTTWEISLATFTITTMGAITLTDDRTFRRSTAMVDTDEIVDGAVTTAKLSSRTRRFLVQPFQKQDPGGAPDYWHLQPGLYMRDAADLSAFGYFFVPVDFVSGLTVKAVVIPALNGDIYSTLNVYYAAAGETYSTHSATHAANATTVAQNKINAIKSTSLASLAAGDYVMLEFARTATDPQDTLADVYFLGFLVEYTADS